MDSDKFIQWKNDYTFESCELDRKAYGKFLSSYIRKQNSPLVLNLDGSWGIGKSYFLRQLYSNLRFEHGLPVIHIDAWLSDFSDDPLLVIISELIDQMAAINTLQDCALKEEALLKFAAKYSKKAWNLLAIAGGTYVSGVTGNSAVVELTKKFTFEDEDYQKVGKKLNEVYMLQKDAIDDIKISLEQFAQLYDGDAKVYILIDELDRCRPNYAIEFLEVIKHFFELKNYVFIIATDTEQLSKSIKAVYGNEFDGKEYLSRFFSRTAKIPKPDLKNFASLLIKKSTLADKIEKMFFLEGEQSQDGLAHILSVVGNLYELSLRRLEQLFSKYESIVLHCDGDVFDTRLLLQLMCESESEFYRESYNRKRLYKKLGYPETTQLQKDAKGHNPDYSIDLAFTSLDREQKVIFKDEPSIFKEAYKFAHIYGKVLNSSKVSADVGFVKSTMNENYESTKKADTNFLTYKRSLGKYGALMKFWTIDDYFRYIELAHDIS
ncbi:P-loop NTPase fold protein [Pseudoalteromonas sp. Z9A5]|uniref:KAP family P-loop NTPase fold protein n=1 Tax=Pseudoalteromonas sp. Z9A5 TaxID=2686355 RepID=UPI00140D9940|nr:P-loop NTPase fold protein [Pseudoalteromonas sp. Z9A5]